MESGIALMLAKQLLSALTIVIAGINTSQAMRVLSAIPIPINTRLCEPACKFAGNHLSVMKTDKQNPERAKKLRDLTDRQRILHLCTC